MHATVFNDILERRLELSRRVLVKKAWECGPVDRLENFKVAARILKTTPARACFSFSIKHLVSIMDILDKIENGEAVSSAVLDEKIGDMINYLIMMEACIRNETGEFVFKNKEGPA